jgi:hypothetical protein
MYKLNCLIFSLALLGAPASGQNTALQTFTAMPQSFEPNRGQAAKTFDFISHGPGYSLSLNPGSAVLQLVAGSTPAHEEHAAEVRLRLVGADPAAHSEGLDRQAAKTNYFLGNDSSRWLTDIPQFSRVEYHGIYPGIDIAYYGNNQRLEYDFILQPHADPGRIRFAVDGADRIRIDAAGDLVLTIGSAEIREHKPLIYEETGNGRRVVQGRYIALKDNQIGFELARYDESRALVIDPVIVFSTYFGGSGADSGAGIALDSGGNIYITGTTASASLPGIDIGSPAFNTAAFVAKVSPAGTLISTTIIAGTNDTAQGDAVALDVNGNIYLTGLTRSAGFPTLNPLQTYGGNADVFVLELNNAGNALIYSTYLGGSLLDYPVGIAVDFSGNALVTGNTLSPNFPVNNAYQSQPAGGGPFAAKIAPGGSSLVYSTYYGGDGFVNGMTVDSTGDLIIYGDTEDTSLPVVNALPGICVWTQGGSNLSHGWVAELNISGFPIFSTYVCGSGTDAVRGAAVDSAGNLVVTGNTASSSFPTKNPIQGTYGGGANSAFVAKLTTAGALVYSTYLGGSGAGAGADEGRGVVLDQLGNAYVTGQTTSTNFPTVNPTQSHPAGGQYAFLTKINAAGSAIVFSTYIGGGDGDAGYGLAVDSLANAYVAGTTSSTNFPTTPSSLQLSYGGGSSDAFLTVISTCSIALSSPAPFGPASGTGTTSVTTTPECGWTEVSDSSWITITSSPASGAGSGSVSWSVAQNSGPLRSGELTIAGKAVTITQSGPATPTITWSAPPAITYGTPLSGTQLDANSGGVAGTFVYTPPAGTVLLAGNGETLSVKFTPTDTVDYTTGTATTTINVNKATPIVTWPAPAAITSGTPLSPTQLDATTGVAGTLVYNPIAGTILPVGNGQTLSVTFNPTDTTDYTSASGSTTISVMPQQPVDVSSQVQVTTTGMIFSRATSTYNGTLTIKNIGSTPIAAPLQSVFANLSAAATLTNATGTVPAGPYAGAFYITVPGNSPLAPGASVTISVQFRETGTGGISYVPKTLSGSF